MTHSTDATDAPKSRRTTGRMMLTTLPSSADMKVPSPMASRTPQREREDAVTVCNARPPGRMR